MSDSDLPVTIPPKRERGARRSRARQIVAARLEKLEDLSISKLVPSTLTLLGLCSGATAIRYAVMGEWQIAHQTIDSRNANHACLINATCGYTITDGLHTESQHIKSHCDIANTGRRKCGG